MENQPGNVKQFRYCSVFFSTDGREWAQEIKRLRLDGQEVSEWKGEPWINFLNQMGQQGWELVSVATIASSVVERQFVAYFKRSA